MPPALRPPLAATAAAILALTAAGCSSHGSGVSGDTEPAGPGMCAFMSKAQLAQVVGPLRDTTGPDGTMHDACGWRVRGSEGELGANNGYVIWDTEQSLEEFLGGPGRTSERVQVRGHPGVLAQSQATTLLVVSTGDSTAEPGTVSVSLTNGRQETRDKARTLAEAALRYVESHR